MKVAAIYKESVLALTGNQIHSSSSREEHESTNLAGKLPLNLIKPTSGIYDEREAESIVNILFEDLLNISRIQRLTNSQLELSEEQFRKWLSALEQLKDAVPVQHITGFGEFYGRKFFVNEHTLIPRPETEELIHLIISENQGKSDLQILDIGTGTGCIAVCLALGLTNSDVSAWDISEGALAMASKNADALVAHVHFELKDVLTSDSDQKFDIIVSNPPYIPNQEFDSMHSNVTKYEPGSALFVPDNDPLIFYRKIGELGVKSLNEGGKLYFEIHENFGLETKSLLEQQGYQDIQIHQDLNGKDRMISASSQKA